MRRMGVWLLALSWMTTGAAADDKLDYGEYLAGECTGCHRLYQSYKGLRLLAGWDKRVMISVLRTYRKEEADNDTMNEIAKILDDEQIEALAVYFASLRRKAR